MIFWRFAGKQNQEDGRATTDDRFRCQEQTGHTQPGKELVDN